MLRATLTWTVLYCTITVGLYAQTLGGQAVYNFLKLPAGVQLTALGGINVSNISEDLSLAFGTPSLLRPSAHAQLSTNFTSLYAGVKNYQAMAGMHLVEPALNIGLGIHDVDYGSLTQTDAAGNTMGSFKPGDFSLQAVASRQYLNRWFYGITLKFIHSNYGLYRSSAVAADIGLTYYDSSTALQASLVMKNMGAQISFYGDEGEDLPFDLQMGITKRLQNAPLQFSLTAHHLHRFNLLYNDTVFNNDNSFPGRRKPGFENIFRHFVLAAQAYAGDKIELSLAYNYLRRAELGIPNATNGLTGFSFGAGVLFRRLQIRYARAYYQNTRAYNQFGLNLRLQGNFGRGELGQRSGW